MSGYGEQKEKVIPVSNFFKSEEYITDDFQSAESLANELFSGFGERGVDGSRTSETAKVRIRRQGDRFRVILYKHVSTRKTKEVPEEAALEDRPTPRRKKRRQGKRRHGKTSS